MKNVKHVARDGYGVVLALPVASTVGNGSVVNLGNGLVGLAITARATTATINAGTAAPALKDGEASVALIGIGLTVEVTANVDIAQFDKVYVTSGGLYTNVASGNTLIGWALKGGLATQKFWVGLAAN